MADTYQSWVYGAELTPAIGGVSQFASDLATLVADGASPTQAHVTAVANDWSAMSGGSAAGTASITQAAILVIVDTSVVTSASVLDLLLRKAVSYLRREGLAP